MKYSDSHCHIDFPELYNVKKTLFNQCLSLGIHRILVPAVCPNNWQKVLSLPSQDHNLTVKPCLGIHPWYLQGLTFKDLDNLADLAKKEQDKIVAIGETGIDGTIALQQGNMAKQKTFLEYQIGLANALKKPMVLHHRRCHNELMNQLKQKPIKYGGVIHAFSGSYQQGKTYVDMGFKLGIGGTLTYPRAKKTINAIKRFPLNTLLLETDAPAMPLFGEQGKANSPINLIKIFNALSHIRKEDKQQLAQQLEVNFTQLFGG